MALDCWRSSFAFIGGWAVALVANREAKASGQECPLHAGRRIMERGGISD
jgi:hypothetical protein